MKKKWSKEAGQVVSGQAMLIALAVAVIYFGVVGTIKGVKWVYHEADNFVLHLLGKPPAYGNTGFKDANGRELVVKYTKAERDCYPYLEWVAGLTKTEPNSSAQNACMQLGENDRLTPPMK